MQFQDFNAAWNKYLEEYDRMAQMYVQQMTERHAIGLMEHQTKLQQELRDKPPKWSKVFPHGRGGVGGKNLQKMNHTVPL